MVAKGFRPSLASPAAKVTPCCSAMPTSKQRVVDVVAVDRAHVEEAELVEQRAAGDQAAGIFLHVHGALLEERRQELGELLDGVAHRAIGAPRHETGEI